MTASQAADIAVVKSLVGSGAKLGRVLLGAPGIHANDLLEIRNGNQTIWARAVWRVSSPAALGELFLDDWQKEDLSVRETDTVHWRKAEPDELPPLSEVHL